MCRTYDGFPFLLVFLSRQFILLAVYDQSWFLDFFYSHGDLRPEACLGTKIIQNVVSCTFTVLKDIRIDKVD